MTDEEKQAIEKIHNGKKMDLISIIRTFKREGIENFVVTKKETVETVLNLIEKQQTEIKKYKEMYAVSVADRVNSAFKQEHKNNEDLEMLYKGCQIELEEKDKRISDLEFALMDMVLQFADENKDSISTMGLSALEIAFNELNFDNPMSIKEVHKRYKELAQKYYQ